MLTPVVHTKDVERLATVGDQVWVAWLMKVSSYLYKMDLKHFPTSQIDEAWEWIYKEDDV